MALPTERLKARETEKIHEQELMDEGKPTAPAASNPEQTLEEKHEKELEKQKIEQDALQEDTGNISMSTFATLDLLRKRGLLNKGANNVFVGRNKDEKFHQQSEKTGAKMQEEDDGLTLEYRDNKGRLMSKKQAYRYGCWAFHGKKPQKLKQEKMEKKVKAEQSVV